ncbi:unnamed protein product [Gadus morhua 'NCC']
MGLSDTQILLPVTQPWGLLSLRSRGLISTLDSGAAGGYDQHPGQLQCPRTHYGSVALLQTAVLLGAP